MVGWLRRDPGLQGSTDAPSFAKGLAAADALNQLIALGLAAVGRSAALELTAADLVALNAWVRSDPSRLQAFIDAHGNEEGAVETGFHRLVNNGASQLFHDNNLVNTVLDSVYHYGFPIDASGQFLNEDGTANAPLRLVAHRLSALRVDVATTDTNLDRMTEAILADAGLANTIPLSQIKQGAEAANGLSKLILTGMASIPANTGSDANRIEVSEVLAINSWIRSDRSRYNSFMLLHGDDEGGIETGFHLVQNNGGSTTQFGLNLINTVLDGIFHIGFAVDSDGRFRNEDGDANALVSDVADWLDYYLGDPSTTGSGLDRIVDTARWDAGLATCTPAAQIRGGLAAANQLNELILKAVNATQVNQDGWISRGDLHQLSQWIQTNQYDDFLADHGNDEGGVETGFHLIQGDHGNVQAMGNALIDTVADGIYHIGFAIKGDHFLNEDGNQNAALGDVSSWLNYYLNDQTQIIGTGENDRIQGTDVAEQLVGRDGNDRLEGSGGNDLLDGSWGDDTLLGGDGNDQLDGSYGTDWLNGAEGSDTYFVTGTAAGGWSSFNGYDTYVDTGTTGTDRILAVGPGDVEIGLTSFGANTGIERIEAAPGTGKVTLLGGWNGDSLDFSNITLVGTIVFDGAFGNDTITGGSNNDTLIGGGNDDLLNGGQGSDTYIVTGNGAGGWASFSGYDTYVDTGTTGTDRILAVGPGDVEIGLTSFGANTGIERIEAAPGTGKVTLLGGWGNDSFDFSRLTSVVKNLLIDTGSGNDVVTGSSAGDRIDTGHDQDRLVGGLGADQLTGGSGADTFVFNSAAEIGITPGRCDLITDFVSLVDKIDLFAIDANSTLVGNQAFIYVGATAFSGRAGELRLWEQTLSGDINGDREADFRLNLINVASLVPSLDLRL
ncbi:MAG: calcium-binding protein [Cyanobacteriota bacterium]|nr:calcium-binding protein [Cyanobacteriota bacterium]